jgi:Glycosyl hydrolase family 9
MRETAALLNQTYYNHSVGNHIYALTTRHYYETEAAIDSGDFTNANYSADEVSKRISATSTNWIYSYALSRLLDYYSRFGFAIPKALESTIDTRISKFFNVYYVGPFKVVNGENDGELRLFGRPGFADYHGVINYDMFSHMYLQSLIGNIWPEKANLTLIQYEFDYLFGMNPLALCQMDGVGGDFVNKIHHRYGYADYPSGRVPGGIINGISNIQPSKDWATRQGISDENMGSRWLYVEEQAWVDYWDASPLVSDGVDSNCNEIWIPHNAVFLEWVSYYTKNYL